MMTDSSSSSNDSINNSIVISPNEINFQDGNAETLLENERDKKKKTSSFQTIANVWSKTTGLIHREIITFILFLSQLAAKNPVTCIVSMIVLSISVLAVGFATNFTLSLNPEEVFTPFNSRAGSHGQWLNDESGFQDTRTIPVYVLLHDRGGNVLTKDATSKLFRALDVVRGTVGYNDVCEQGEHVDAISRQSTCWISSATRHWNHDTEQFLDSVSVDQDVADQMSLALYPGGTPVSLPSILGNHDRSNEEEGKLLWAQSYSFYLKLPALADGVKDVELAMIENLFQLKDDIESDPDSTVRVEFSSPRSLQDEVVRALIKDMPLLPLVFLIMTVFTCIIFFRPHKVLSRCMLGLGAIITIVLSIMTSFGLMFCFGVPFSVITQILPFIIFGIGLDDTFIITGAFFRTEESHGDPVERIRRTMADIGMSIGLTTITTMVAFILSSLSSIQAVRWLGMYASTAIFVDFIYQITFFVAVLVLDERRVQANRRDIFCCFRVATEDDSNNNDADEELSSSSSHIEDQVESTPIDTEVGEKKRNNRNIAETFMIWYSNNLFKPAVKIAVIVLFLALFACCAYSTTHLKQEFKSEDFVPDDSYVRNFIKVLEDYYPVQTITSVYFRDVDQSDPEIQQKMIDYVESLTDNQYVGMEAPLCWVRDLLKLQDSPEYAELMGNMSFNEKIDAALANPAIEEAFGGDIVRDSSGYIKTSRCWVLIGNLNIDAVEDQIDFLNQQRALSETEPMNQDRTDWAFFSFAQIYFVWEFYAAIEYELIFTTITGAIAVTLITFLLISHWSAVCFVLPLIVILYIDVLGSLRFLGLQINSMTFICIVISIGLLVDFLMHILLRYYETPGKTREEKARRTLQTMGSSILVGGFSTFIAILPLGFSTSIIVRTVFRSFFAMVTLGVTHGLILLPVLLSLFGPVKCIRGHGIFENDAKDTLESSLCDTASAKHADELESNTSPVKEKTQPSDTSSSSDDDDRSLAKKITMDTSPPDEIILSDYDSTLKSITDYLERI